MDAQARIDLSKLGLWEGLSLTIQGFQNYGNSVNGHAGSLTPVNAALYFPGINAADASDIMALNLTQKLGDLAAVTIGKINLVDVARGTPLWGGGCRPA